MDLDRLLLKVKNNNRRFQGKLPKCCMNSEGQYELYDGGTWTDGFWVGVLYLAYLISNDDEFLNMAIQYDNMKAVDVLENGLPEREDEILYIAHDLGFVFLLSQGLKYKITGDERAKQICIKAADRLCDRFNEKGGFIRAWDTWPFDTDPDLIEEKKGKMIIDCMMNIPLLFWATELTGDKKYYNVACCHAKSVAKHMVRSDYSTCHTFNFNHITGEPLCEKTAQGYADDSCWSRGQSWAVYGFALAYVYTNDTEFLKIAKETARYFMKQLSAFDLPCWDFSAKSQLFAPWDSSAAAICAAGCLEIERLSDNQEEKDEFKEYSLRLLSALDKWCVTSDYPDVEPLLYHGCVGQVFAKNHEDKLVIPVIGQGLVYGDYFYLECLLRLKGNDIRIW